jgi:TrmH family RNA methyltransferase
LGASARARRLPWPLLDARAAAARALGTAAADPVAIVFGRERSGLSNAELDRCDAHLQIPCNPDFASLNLAAAVQVVAYELRLAAGAALAEPDQYDPPATAAELEGFYRHLEEVATAAGFLDPERPKWLMRRLRRLFARAVPESAEINILRGLLKALDPRR